ncbi:MAG TPA: Ig-like domain-containing protein [Candidatus Acidoferrum sp.]|nr:Ig-like domain-containing protein [Candidatus Acidoferrum sp.]
MPLTKAGNYGTMQNSQSSLLLNSHQYKLTTPQSDLNGGYPNQELIVSILPSLYNYFSNMSHTLDSDSDYAKFVTPQAVAPIAEMIENITRNLPHSDEQFADTVLTMVHQIPYNITSPKYPIETLQDNSGDCVELSLLAASIMEAGGLDVILIHYTGINPGHMNIGICLSEAPVFYNLLLFPNSFEYNNKTYWTAEATGEENWKVGDQSGALLGAEAVIIPLENNESKSSPTQVSASLEKQLLPSAVTINLSQQQTNDSDNVNARALTISGSVSPPISGKNVTIYVNDKQDPNDYFTAVTNGAGEYISTWNFSSTGAYYITASLNGDSNFAGADSETIAVFVGPQSYLQFQTPEYNYIFGQLGQGNYATAPMQGVNNFLSIPIGTNVSLSYDFIIIHAGNTVSNVQTTNVTIPASQETIRSGKQTKIVSIPAKTIEIPISVPPDLVPFRLEDDFNQSLNTQFCFILQNNNGSSYSLDVKALNDDDISSLIQDNGTSADFINVTQNLKENTWYQMTTIISDAGVTSSLRNLNSTIIFDTPISINSEMKNKTVTLITNNQNNAIVFKNLEIESLNQTQLPQTPEKTIIDYANIIPYIPTLSLIVTTFIEIFYYKRKKKTKFQSNSNC